MHRNDPPLDFYLLGALCDVWRSRGHEIVELHGLAEPVRGDIVFLHVDLTVVPDEYIQAVAAHPRVVNRAAIDISKTRTSPIQVHSPDEWDGPVIVKTVRNHGGHPERRLRRGTILGRLSNGIDKVRGLSLGYANHLDPHNYPVFPSTRTVPRRVFSNPALMVERFVPERQGEYYCTRVCSFLGDCAISQMRASRHQLPTVEHAAFWEDVPFQPEIVESAGTLGFRYGRFDYVVHGDQVTLLDANRTVGRPKNPDILRRRVEALEPALESLLD
jgi:hypothetical protein